MWDERVVAFVQLVLMDMRVARAGVMPTAEEREIESSLHAVTTCAAKSIIAHLPRA